MSQGTWQDSRGMCEWPGREGKRLKGDGRWVIPFADSRDLKVGVFTEERERMG